MSRIKAGMKVVKFQKSLELGSGKKGRFNWNFVSNFPTVLEIVLIHSEWSIEMDVWKNHSIIPKKATFYCLRKYYRHFSLFYLPTINSATSV